MRSPISSEVAVSTLATQMLQNNMKCRHVALAAILLGTGSYNTLSIKWANTLSSEVNMY